MRPHVNVFLFVFFLCFLMISDNADAAGFSRAYPADGVYSLQPKCAPGAELSTENQRKSNGVNVVISPYAANNLKWRITRIGNTDWYKIMVEGSDVGLNVDNGRNVSGTNITLWNYGGAWQQFCFWDIGEGGYYLLQGNIGGNKAMVLDVAGGGNAKTANVWSFEHNNTDAQKWKLVKVGGEPAKGNGDVNGDGKIDKEDLGLLTDLRFQGKYVSNGDMDGNGKIDMTDISMLKQKIGDVPDTRVVNHNPQGNIIQIDSPSDYTLHVKGRAFDEDNPNGTVRVHVYVGGTPGSDVPQYEILANKNNHEFEDTRNIGNRKTGTQTVHVYALNDFGPGTFQEIWSGNVNIKPGFQPYQDTARQTGPAYTNAALTQRNGNERVDAGDVCTILKKEGNAWFVDYPAGNTRKQRWVDKKIFEEPPNPNDNIKKRLEQLANNTNGYRMGTKYTGSGQCRGFANKVYMATFKGVQYIGGYANSNYSASSYAGSYEAGRLFNFSSNDTNAVKNLFNKAKVGAFVQMGRRHSLNSTKTAPSPHSAIVYSINDSGVQFFEANTDGKNTIRVNTYTWAQLADKNKGFTIYLPNNYALK